MALSPCSHHFERRSSPRVTTNFRSGLGPASTDPWRLSPTPIALLQSTRRRWTRDDGAAPIFHEAPTNKAAVRVALPRFQRQERSRPNHLSPLKRHTRCEFVIAATRVHVEQLSREVKVTTINPP